MNVETILRDKGSWVVDYPPDATIEDAVDTLNRERIGALVVSEAGDEVEGGAVGARHRDRPRQTRHGIVVAVGR